MFRFLPSSSRGLCDRDRGIFYPLSRPRFVAIYLATPLGVISFGEVHEILACHCKPAARHLFDPGPLLRFCGCHTISDPQRRPAVAVLHPDTGAASILRDLEVSRTGEQSTLAKRRFLEKTSEDGRL